MAGLTYEPATSPMIDTIMTTPSGKTLLQHGMSTGELDGEDLEELLRRHDETQRRIQEQNTTTTEQKLAIAVAVRQETEARQQNAQTAAHRMRELAAKSSHHHQQEQSSHRLSPFEEQDAEPPPVASGSTAEEPQEEIEIGLAEAVAYLARVKEEFKDDPEHPDASKSFVAIIRSAYSQMDKTDMISQLLHMFQGHGQLILDFNLFLPKDQKISNEQLWKFSTTGPDQCQPPPQIQSLRPLEEQIEQQLEAQILLLKMEIQTLKNMYSSKDCREDDIHTWKKKQDQTEQQLQQLLQQEQTQKETQLQTRKMEEQIKDLQRTLGAVYDLCSSKDCPEGDRPYYEKRKIEVKQQLQPLLQQHLRQERTLEDTREETQNRMQTYSFRVRS